MKYSSISGYKTWFPVRELKLDILTPEKKIYEGEVYGVFLPGVQGYFEILDKHAPIVAALGSGEMKILLDKTSF